MLRPEAEPPEPSGVVGVVARAVVEPGEREARAERYGLRAVALLEKLQGTGHFKDAGHAQSLQSDENLRALRDRGDYQRLLKQVEGMKK